MSYLKNELTDVVSRVESSNPGASILTAAVFTATRVMNM
jgi:hypothetical protein